MHKGAVEAVPLARAVADPTRRRGHKSRFV
jgi:hypothetical protein